MVNQGGKAQGLGKIGWIQIFLFLHLLLKATYNMDS